jgi:cyclase
MNRRVVLGAVIVAGGFGTFIAAQQPARAVLPDLMQVKNNLYMIDASSPTDRTMFTGGNTAVLVTSTGVVIVDTKLAGYGPDILAKIRKVTDKPVTTIINTHTHGDHTGSNEGFPTSVDIVAHENTKANMEKMDAFKGDKAKYLPKRTYKDRLTVGSGNDRMELYYFGRGHTNGDTFIVYPALRVLQTGDMFPWKDAPFYDPASGGSTIEFPKTLAKAIAATLKDADIVLPGHSPLMKPADLEEYQRYTAELVTTAEAARKAGKSADDALAAMSAVTAKYPGYRSDRLKGAVDAIYAELGK